MQELIKMRNGIFVFIQAQNVIRIALITHVKEPRCYLLSHYKKIHIIYLII